MVDAINTLTNDYYTATHGPDDKLLKAEEIAQL